MKQRTRTDADIHIRDAVRHALANPEPNAFGAAFVALWDACAGRPPREELQGAWNTLAKKLGGRPPRAPEDPEDLALKSRVHARLGALNRGAKRHWLDDRKTRKALERATREFVANHHGIDRATADPARKWGPEWPEAMQDPERGRGQPRKWNDALVYRLYVGRLEANRRAQPNLLKRPCPLDRDEVAELANWRPILKRATGKTVDFRSPKWPELETFSRTQLFLGDIPADTLKGIIKRERKRLKSLQS